MRRIGEPWRPAKRYRDRPGVYAIIAGSDGNLLLVDQDGEIQLPGGGINPGEQPLQALHREVREETGWRISVPRRFGAFQRFAYLPEYGYWARKVQHIFLAQAVARIPGPLEVGHTPFWTPPEVAARILDVEGDRVMVARAIARALV